MKYTLSIFLGLLFITLSAFAGDREFDPGKEMHLLLTVTNKDNQSKKVHAFYYKNANGAPEVRLEAADLPRVADGINPILGYGRDLDDDGKFDTWFMYSSKEGYTTWSIPSQDPLARDVIQNVLFRNYQSSADMNMSAATSSILSYLSIAVSNAYESQREFDWEVMDLLERDLRLQRQTAIGPLQLTSEQYAHAKAELEEARRRSLEKFDHATNRDYWRLGAADIGLWVTGGILMKWLSPVFAGVGKAITGNAIVKEGQEIIGNFINKHIATLGRALPAVSDRIPLGMTIVPLKAMGDAAFKKLFRTTTRALIARGRLGRAVLKITPKIAEAAQAAGNQWKYIAINVALQSSSEAVANAKEIEDPNPVVEAQKLFSRPETQQNLAYMTADTVEMTAMSNMMKTNRMKFMACGFVALNDSFFANVVLKGKGKQDYTRIAFDTGWEVGIGNAQVQLDMASLNFFEKMAQKSGNAKLKLLGYAVVLVDQGVGYYGYAKAASAVEAAEQKHNIQPVLVPVLVNN